MSRQGGSVGSLFLTCLSVRYILDSHGCFVIYDVWPSEGLFEACRIVFLDEERVIRLRLWEFENLWTPDAARRESQASHRYRKLFSQPIFAEACSIYFWRECEVFKVGFIVKGGNSPAFYVFPEHDSCGKTRWKAQR